MAKITLARSAGFCFGVARAVEMCERLANEGKRLATLGPIIHNKQVIAALEQKHVRIIDSPEQADPGELIVVRSHGVSREVYARCTERGGGVVDATCPYVAKIHGIVAAHKDGTVVIIGDKTHPEVEALVGHCNGNAMIFADKTELMNHDFSKMRENSVIIVAQTTYNLLQYNECVEYARTVFANLKSYDTVCGATRSRQLEADELSRKSDVCIVIGDAKSSNTGKLLEVCEKNCRAYLVETAQGLTAQMLEGATEVGVTAGASTPAGIIEEVLIKMSDILNQDPVEVTTAQDSQVQGEEEELNFEEAVELYLKRASRNQRYVGVVTSVLPNEVVVDIGTKQTGIVPFDEMTDDNTAKLEELVKKGDKLNLVAIKVNDSEGIVTLSKKRLDAIDGFSAVSAAAADGTVLDAFVTDKVNAGVIAYYKGVRIFIHESQATMHKGDSLDALLKTNVKLKITEVKGPHSVRGSIRRALLDERDAVRDEFWKTVENGKKYRGVVKSLTSYGAFVDIGGVDGMIHISELSWRRVKHPSEVVNVGDEIDVYVKNADAENRKISLGYKKEEDNPWNQLRLIPIGTVFTGPVVSMIKSGAFVRILPNLDGFVHISQISSNNISAPQDVLSIGQIVDARLIDVDFERQRISLSLRDENEPEETPAE